MTDPTTTAEVKRRADYDAMLSNLTATQAECTRLLERNRALEADNRALTNAMNGEPKVGKRRKQVMRALGMPTEHASEHSPTWDELCESVARLATNVSDSATWLDEHCPEGWGCEQSVVPSNGWYAYDAKGRTPLYYPTPRLAREALARMRGWSGPTAQTPPPSAEVGLGRAETPPVVSVDPNASQRVTGAARGWEGTARVEGTAKPDVTAVTVPIDGAPNGVRIKVTVNGKTGVFCVGCGNSERLVHGPVGVSLCCDCIDALAYAAKAARAGYDPMAEPPPDPCPLPADARQWRRNDSHDIVFQVAPSEYWRVTVVGPRGQHEYWVRHERPGKSNYPDSIVAKAECKTVRGGLRLGVKEARRIWRVKNGGKL